MITTDRPSYGAVFLLARCAANTITIRTIKTNPNPVGNAFHAFRAFRRIKKQTIIRHVIFHATHRTERVIRVPYIAHSKFKRTERMVCVPPMHRAFPHVSILLLDKPHRSRYNKTNYKPLNKRSTKHRVYQESRVR